MPLRLVPDTLVSIRSRLVQAGERVNGSRIHRETVVSIRSRLVQAGELVGKMLLSAASMFQSAPALFRRENPRSFPKLSYILAASMFQSAPALFRRENTHKVANDEQGRPDVSIRSRLVQAGEQP